MVAAVSSNPKGGNFIIAETFQTPRCQYCTEMSDLCWKRKPRYVYVEKTTDSL